MKGFKDSASVSTPTNRPIPLSRSINTTADFFQFRPVFCQEMYPTDSMKVSVMDYFRAEPMAGAVYATYKKRYSAFFVPYRILWDDWSDYLSGGSNGRLELIEPWVTFKDFVDIAEACYADLSNGTTAVQNNKKAIYRNMLDFWSDLGVPIDKIFGRSADDQHKKVLKPEAANFHFPLKRFLAVRKIWFNWFRDQNLIGDDVEEDYCPTKFNADGEYVPTKILSSIWTWQPFANNLLVPPPVSVEKDYFTTAMTEPQRGGAAFIPVQLPSFDVNSAFGDTTSVTNIRYQRTNDTTSVLGTSAGSDIIGMFDYNAIRVAKGFQKFMEKHNISGGSDLQFLLAEWGTAPNPAVFQKSVYIGSFTDDFAPQEVVGNMNNDDTAMGEVSTKINASGKGSFDYTANEHGFFIIIQTIRPDNTYVGGIDREVLHGCLGNGRFDYFTDEFEKTGFQPQYGFERCSEVFFESYGGNIDDVVGYVPRYAECKRAINRFTGQMATPLYQNLRVARDQGNFDSIPPNGLFINTNFTMVYGYPADYPYDLVFKNELPLYDHLQGWIYFKVDASRPMHEYSAPLVEDSKGNDITLPYAGVRM